MADREQHLQWYGEAYRDGQSSICIFLFLLFIGLASSENSSRVLVSNLAASNGRSDPTLAGRTNKLYFALNHEKSPATSIPPYQRVSTVKIIPVDGPSQSRNHFLRRQPQASTPVTFNKDRVMTAKKQETRNYSNHERLPMQTSPLLKTTIPKPATFIPRPLRVRHISRLLEDLNSFLITAIDFTNSDSCTSKHEYPSTSITSPDSSSRAEY